MTTQIMTLLTRGVSERVADDADFAKFVTDSLTRFHANDWGTVCAEDATANDEAIESLQNGGWYGRVLASYRFVHVPIWITRNTAMEDGTQAITVMFPEEY